MFINEIIWSYNSPSPTRLNVNHNTILFYSNDNWIWPPKKYHIQTQGKIKKDERGYYYIKKGMIAQTMAKNSLSDKSILDSNDIIYKDGKIYGMKVRKIMSETRYMTVIKTGNNITSYPTEKPYKLMERIICLSTI